MKKEKEKLSCVLQEHAFSFISFFSFFSKKKAFHNKKRKWKKETIESFFRTFWFNHLSLSLFIFFLFIIERWPGLQDRIRKMKKEKLCGSCRSKDRSIFDWIRTNTFHFPFSLILSCQVSLLTVKDFSFEKRKDFMGTWAWAPKRLLFEHSRNEIFLFLKKNHFQ